MGAGGGIPIARFSHQRSLLYPTGTPQQPCDRGWEGPVLPSCLSLPHTELIGCPQPVPTPECSQSASPGLPDYKYDTPLTHVSLHASSHGSTQLAVCQVQSHPWAEGPRVFFVCLFSVSKGHFLMALLLLGAIAWALWAWWLPTAP